MSVQAVACPTCGSEVHWTDASAWRPFCSARCKSVDLGDWASDRFVIPGASSNDAAGRALSPSDTRRD
jgi:endogenous inhibitor of DNA gyrase (YacG/DUF329 family)